jgi:excisionase family DNA binding protein
MAMRRGREDEAGSGERWLEVDASMTGTLAFKDPVHLQINGRFEGTLDTKGNLSIGERASVKATIRGEAITVTGSVEGNITATRRVELGATARVSGKITSPRLVMQEGAILQGTVEMQGERGGGSPWMSTEELARYLEIEPDTVIAWAREGRLPAKREGDQWRFERTKIEEWLAAEKVK